MNLFTRKLQPVLDSVMSVLMYLLLSSQYTGMLIHEICGILLIVCTVLHQVLNFRWYRALRKGRYNAVRIIFTIADLALLTDMVFLILSGLARGHEIIPRHLIPIPSSAATQMHLVSGYLAFLLMGFHLGLHIRHVPKIPGILISVFGIWALIHENFFLYISGGAHFVMFHDGQPAWFYMAELIGIWGLMIAAAAVLKTFTIHVTHSSIQN